MYIRKAARFLLFPLTVGSAPYTLQATVPPEDYPLVKASEVDEVDPALEVFLETYGIDRVHPVDLSKADSTGLRKFILPLQTARGLTPENNAAVELYFTQLETNPKLWRQFLQDPLAPVLLEELFRAKSKVKNLQSRIGLYLRISKEKSGARSRLLSLFSKMAPAEFAAPTALKPPPTRLNWVQQAMRGKNCDAAQGIAISTWLHDKSKLKLKTEIEHGDAVVRCYKSKGTAVQEKFRPLLVKRFGNEAASWISIKRARILWNGNQDTVAWQILEKIRNSPNDPARADAIYLSARMKENNGAADQAIALFSEFLAQFPTDADAPEVQKALASFYAQQGKWEATRLLCDTLLIQEDRKDLDDRSLTDAGFALLWGGRAYYNLGQPAKARDYWVRLMTEYYSTYYGAMGQYLVEQIDDQSYAVYPAYTKSFKTADLFGSYDNGENRGFLTRAFLYMQTSRWSEARYEINALKDDTTEQKVGKSLLLYAIGDWLPAVKLFADLPRSLRSTLPRGMERIVFPRRYEDQVLSYAEKVHIDPDFVFSLIRQESVFNPLASSPAGAKGLMQLMDATAKTEASKLTFPYVTHKEKNYAVGMTRKKKGQGLFDSDLNLMLGVHHLSGLLAKYKNPVFTLSAYNAGPTPTARWIEKFQTKDILFFIEKIPYKETQGYVKLILRNYFCYKKWYTKAKRFPQLEKILDRLFVHTKPSRSSPYVLD